MEFDSPEQEVEKEFPGLYGKPEAVDMMSDPVDCKFYINLTG